MDTSAQPESCKAEHGEISLQPSGRLSNAINLNGVNLTRLYQGRPNATDLRSTTTKLTESDWSHSSVPSSVARPSRISRSPFRHMCILVVAEEPEETERDKAVRIMKSSRMMVYSIRPQRCPSHQRQIPLRPDGAAAATSTVSRSRGFVQRSSFLAHASFVPGRRTRVSRHRGNKAGTPLSLPSQRPQAGDK